MGLWQCPRSPAAVATGLWATVGAQSAGATAAGAPVRRALGVESVLVHSDSDRGWTKSTYETLE